ncbi:MAG: NADP-dependent oxidoreductase [Pseudomonadota bacterium]
MNELPETMRQWVLARRPEGLAVGEDFRLETAPLPAAGPGEVLVKTQYLGVAPVMLRYMNNETDFERDLAIGDVMHGRGVGFVVESRHPGWQAGDLVCAKLRWREYAVFAPDDPYYMPFRLRHPDLKASYGVGALGYNGYTALVGLRDIAGVRAGDQVLVTGAAGGVGCNVAFVARALGAARIVGVAGGPDKCRLLTDKLGYDAAIDYKAGNTGAAMESLLPDGIDACFDNVGGELLDQAMGRINRRARITLCGRISEYLKDRADYHRPRNFYRISYMDAKVEGFFIYDYADAFDEHQDTLAAWVRSGALEPHEDLLEGLESMPAALIGLYEGTNSGVRAVRIDPAADAGR